MKTKVDSRWISEKFLEINLKYFLEQKLITGITRKTIFWWRKGKRVIFSCDFRMHAFAFVLKLRGTLKRINTGSSIFNLNSQRTCSFVTFYLLQAWIGLYDLKGERLCVCIKQKYTIIWKACVAPLYENKFFIVQIINMGLRF